MPFIILDLYFLQQPVHYYILCVKKKEKYFIANSGSYFNSHLVLYVSMYAYYIVSLFCCNKIHNVYNGVYYDPFSFLTKALAYYKQHSNKTGTFTNIQIYLY